MDFPQSPKNCKKWQKMAFFAQMSGFRENGPKSQKSGRATFLTLLTPNFVQGFGKILRAVSEIICDTRTDGARTAHGRRTDGPDSIGPFRFSTGDQKSKINELYKYRDIANYNETKILKCLQP